MQLNPVFPFSHLSLHLLLQVVAALPPVRRQKRFAISWAAKKSFGSSDFPWTRGRSWNKLGYFSVGGREGRGGGPARSPSGDRGWFQKRSPQRTSFSTPRDAPGPKNKDPCSALPNSFSLPPGEERDDTTRERKSQREKEKYAREIINHRSRRILRENRGVECHPLRLKRAFRRALDGVRYLKSAAGTFRKRTRVALFVVRKIFRGKCPYRFGRLRAHVMKTRHRKGYLSSDPREWKRNSRIFAPSSSPSRAFRLSMRARFVRSDNPERSDTRAIRGSSGRVG